MNNLDIRIAIRDSRFKQYEIVNRLNITETSLCRKLRNELPKDEKEKIIQAIKELKEENKED